MAATSGRCGSVSAAGRRVVPGGRVGAGFSQSRDGRVGAGVLVSGVRRSGAWLRRLGAVREAGTGRGLGPAGVGQAVGSSPCEAGRAAGASGGGGVTVGDPDWRGVQVGWRGVGRDVEGVGEFGRSEAKTATSAGVVSSGSSPGFGTAGAVPPSAFGISPRFAGGEKNALPALQSSKCRAVSW